MDFKSLIVSSVILTEDKLLKLKQEIKDVFKEYESKSISYFEGESSFYGFEDNFAIVKFKEEECATRALAAFENGEMRIDGIIITAKPIEMTYCPIDTLPADCLLEIFNYLSIHEQLKMSEICKRWDEVCTALWTSGTKIDLRDKSLLTKNKKCIITSGSNLKDIHCYDYHGLKTIEEHCKNLESIALEFCSYKKKKKGPLKPGIQDERQILPKFAYLTRLLLKISINDSTYFSFLKNLPSTMIEIHLFNGISNTESSSNQYIIMNHGYFSAGEKKSGKKTLNLSVFPNLRALTLNWYYLEDDSLIGFETLEKLSCLTLDSCHLSQRCLDQLKTFTNLEHLSLTKVPMYYEDMWFILKRNQKLKYFTLPEMIDESFDNEIWLRALELPHLKVICRMCSTCEIEEWGASSTLEYMDLNEESLHLPLEKFPNLKSLKLRGGHDYDTCKLYQQFYARERGDKPRIKYYHSSGIECNSMNFGCSSIVSAEDARMFRCNEWDGWYIEDSSASTKSFGLVDEEPLESMITFRSIVPELSDTYLKKIFYYLPPDDKLTAAKVCKRWKKVLRENWKSCKIFDVRELSRHEKGKECMFRYGQYFEDVYLYKSCGFSVAQCRNVKHLALDFGVKSCECRPSRGKNRWFSFRSFQLTFMRLKYLSRIMLRDAPVFQSDILQHLPETLEEIHVFNRYSMNSRGLIDSQFKDNAIILDLSRYSKLQALTLVEVQVTPRKIRWHQEPSRKITTVIGLENLEELIYLRVSGVIIAEDSEDPLKNIKKLEYLSIPLSMLSSENFVALIENNRNIEYLDITDNFDGAPRSKFLPVLTLKRLKYLRMVNTSRNIRRDISTITSPEIPEEFDFDSEGMPHLEILDCEGCRTLSHNFFLRLIGASPNLKVLNIIVTHADFAEKLMAVIWSNLRARQDGKDYMRAFVGVWGLSLCSHWRAHADCVVLRHFLPTKYNEMKERSHWEGWSTRDDRGNTSRLCSQLLDCADDPY